MFGLFGTVSSSLMDLIKDQPKVGEIGLELKCGKDNHHLVTEGVEGLWHLSKLVSKLLIINEVSLNVVVASGDFLMKLEVLLLQWGCAVLGFPLGCGEDGLQHWWFGFGFGVCSAK